MELEKRDLKNVGKHKHQLWLPLSISYILKTLNTIILGRAQFYTEVI